ncbi:DUF2786 domain-containing protein [Streptomyces albus]|uniref:DUF2786 domain-containing protein n=1 Tax=Streptomyces albus TaxID=1888 RepID=UPI0033D202C1
MRDHAKNEDPKLSKIRALLANAEDPAVTPEAADNYRARAYDLMAKYGIEQAQLAEEQPARDQVTDKEINIDNPWAMERMRLLGQIASALRCTLVQSRRPDGKPGRWVHIFGYESDLHRVEILYTSLLLQMTKELNAAPVPPGVGVRAWRRSWLLGFLSKVGQRLRAAEDFARDQTPQIGGRSTALVLADRSQAAERAKRAKYPRVRKTKTTYSGSGFGEGVAAGARADIGNSRVGGHAREAIGN